MEFRRFKVYFKSGRETDFFVEIGEDTKTMDELAANIQHSEMRNFPLGFIELTAYAGWQMGVNTSEARKVKFKASEVEAIEEGLTDDEESILWY